MDELLPCPFCGGAASLALCGFGTAKGACMDCGADGPYCSSQDAAIAAWNRRSPPSAPRAEAVAWQFRFVFADGKRGPWHCPLAGARPMNTGDPACNGATYEVRDLIPAADEGERG